MSATCYQATGSLAAPLASLVLPDVLVPVQLVSDIIHFCICAIRTNLRDDRG